MRKLKLNVCTLISRLILISVTCCSLSSLAYSAEIKAPKLVVVIVIDGLPQEQVTRYRDQFGPGGFRRLLEQGASFSDAHQAHGVTVTAVGHAAVLTGAYAYQHGIIGNNWIDRQTLASVYCTEDAHFHYIDEATAASSGTAPTNLQATTVGDELRYATGNQSKVITVSGKDRGAILLAGKSGTAYMFMHDSGNFASSTYYMQAYPEWVNRFRAGKPQDQFYGSVWRPLLKDNAYQGDAADALVAPDEDSTSAVLPVTMTTGAGKPDAAYYSKLFASPYIDQLTLEFASAALLGEHLGHNPAGVPDLLGISLSAHDVINHAYGPESRMSHDHLQRLDRMLAQFFTQLDQRVGLDNTLVILTADHGFPNTPEFARENKRDAQRVDVKKMMRDLNAYLESKYALDHLATQFSFPGVLLDYSKIEQKGLARNEVETTAARFLLNYPGVADVFTRTQLGSGALPKTHIATLMQRGWNRQLSADLMIVTKPFWYFGSGNTGTSHGSPYTYDTNVPLMWMGKPWIKPGYYGQYAEVVDIAPSLAHVLRVRPPSASEGRVLTELLR